MARLAGLEPATYGLEGRCSILLSYRRLTDPTAISPAGRGGGIRTPDILLPKQARYQTALHPENGGSGPRAARSLPALRIVGNAQQNAFPHRQIFARIAPDFMGDYT